MFTSISKQNQTAGDENLLDIQVSVCYILKHKIGKRDPFIFIALGVTPFSFFYTVRKFE